jgi:xanthine dehydrogenase accessory factor
MTDFFERIAALRREGQSFVVATVVSRRAPVSAHLGDRAIVFPDGRIDGFVGGACSREIVRRQALEALESGCSRLVSIRPEPDARSGSSSEHVVVPMTCVSEGAIDVFVEPFSQARRFLVVGATPVAEAVARLARNMEYDVVRVVEARERADIEPAAQAHGIAIAALEDLGGVVDGRRPCLAAVVASQGHYDEEALATILRGQVPYVGLVASPKRGAAVRRLLEGEGVPDLGRIRNPAGLDLGARTAAEVALSILAEIVQLHPSSVPAATSGRSRDRAVETDAPRSAGVSSGPDIVSPSHAVDPVCQMQVEIATARYRAEIDDVTYYCCCPHCRARFVEQPQDYLHSGIRNPA